MILDDIVARTRDRVALHKESRPMSVVEDKAERTIGAPGSIGSYRMFQEAIAAPGLSVIAEVRCGDPANGDAFSDLDAVEAAYNFESGDADAISFVPEPNWFFGSEETMIEIRDEINVPLLRRDFIVDPYQIYEAKASGADAVSLMCSILGEQELVEYLDICNSLRMDALVEAHTEDELERAIASKALILGITNRNHADWSTTNDAIDRLRPLVPENRLVVAIGGVRTVEDARHMRDSGADAVLLGEAILRIEDEVGRVDFIRELKDIQ